MTILVFLLLWENNTGWEWLLWIWRFPKDFTLYASPGLSVPRLVKSTYAALPLLCILYILVVLHFSGFMRLSIFYSYMKDRFSLSVFWWWNSDLRGLWKEYHIPSSPLLFLSVKTISITLWLWGPHFHSCNQVHLLEIVLYLQRKWIGLGYHMISWWSWITTDGILAVGLKKKKG